VIDGVGLGVVGGCEGTVGMAVGAVVGVSLGIVGWDCCIAANMALVIELLIVDVIDEIDDWIVFTCSATALSL
jgi:hypothetical protein